MTKRTQRQAILAAIGRREWLLRMLALAAAGCGRGEDRAYARGNTLIAAVEGDRPLMPDVDYESLVFLPLVRRNEQGERGACLATHWGTLKGLPRVAVSSAPQRPLARRQAGHCGRREVHNRSVFASLNLLSPGRFHARR